METVKSFVEWVVEREVNEQELADGWDLVREGSSYFKHTTFDGPVVDIVLREKDQVYLGKTLQNLLGHDVFKVVTHLPVDEEQIVMANTRNLQFPSFLDSTRTSASKVWDTDRDGFRPHAAEGVISFPDSVVQENPDDWNRLMSEVVVVVDDSLTGAQRKDLGSRPLGKIGCLLCTRALSRPPFIRLAACRRHHQHRPVPGRQSGLPALSFGRQVQPGRNHGPELPHPTLPHDGTQHSHRPSTIPLPRRRSGHVGPGHQVLQLAGGGVRPQVSWRCPRASDPGRLILQAQV